MPLFDTVLVANRGEIAVRIIRTLHALGIRAAAVYSDADAGARHVRDADVAFRLGPPPAGESYLRVDRVIEAAVAAGAQALHPGYGFLSENAALAEACAAAGIVFVGPPSSAIAAMGDKISAKLTVAAAGVRVVPGVGSPGITDDELIEASAAVGYPLLIKPSAGGGGKGMRLVTAAAALPGELVAARREARSAFGDDTLLLERFIERPRHIEVQVLADQHGNVVHLGERECSLQRRHQKIVEEAPSPYLDDAQRQVLADQAVAAARSCGYVNAGTVEFIVSGDDPSQAFFMEMNTRLQVEHPVTELVWNVDLVELQLRVAAGERLPFAQGDLRPAGHAVEARVCAEDPGRGFLPSGGHVLALVEPQLPDVRIDSGLIEGGEIGGDYDPLLAKVIAWGPERSAAIARLDGALARWTLLGVPHNVAFLRALLANRDVAAGRLDTGLVERIAPQLAAAAPPDPVVVVAALCSLGASSDARDPWHAQDGWRMGEHAWARWRSRAGDADVEIRLRVRGDRCEHLVGDSVVADRWHRVDASTIELGRTRYRVVMRGQTVSVGHAGGSWTFTERPPRGPAGALSIVGGSGAVVSPMPGVVAAVHVSIGDVVVERQAVVSVEAMKMEHAVLAPFAGTVSAVPVEAGQRVALGEQLAVVDRDGGSEDTAGPGRGPVRGMESA